MHVSVETGEHFQSGLVFMKVDGDCGIKFVDMHAFFGFKRLFIYQNKLFNMQRNLPDMLMK